MKRQVKRSRLRKTAEVEQVTLGESEQISAIQEQFQVSEHTLEAEDCGDIKLATFINDDTIRVSQFGVLEIYIDSEGSLVCILDPNSQSKQRTFGRK